MYLSFVILYTECTCSHIHRSNIHVEKLIKCGTMFGSEVAGKSNMADIASECSNISLVNQLSSDLLALCDIVVRQVT